MVKVLDFGIALRGDVPPNDTLRTHLSARLGIAGTIGYMDNDGPSGTRVTLAVVYGAAWLFLWGGILDRYARRRRVGAHAFFGTCGVFFFRFLRLALIAAITYWFFFGIVHGVLFDRLYPWLTRDLDTERTAFLIRVMLYVIYAALLAAIVLLFDLAKARAVVEDRRSMRRFSGLTCRPE